MKNNFKGLAEKDIYCAFQLHQLFHSGFYAKHKEKTCKNEMDTLIITSSHNNGVLYRTSLLAFVVLAAEFFINMGHTNTHRVLWLQKFTITCATF